MIGHTLMDAVIVLRTPLIDDPGRFRTVTAVVLDETRFVPEGICRHTYCTVSSRL